MNERIAGSLQSVACVVACVHVHAGPAAVVPHSAITPHSSRAGSALYVVSVVHGAHGLKCYLGHYHVTADFAAVAWRGPLTGRTRRSPLEGRASTNATGGCIAQLQARRPDRALGGSGSTWQAATRMLVTCGRSRSAAIGATERRKKTQLCMAMSRSNTRLTTIGHRC
jgi:hypothetical protein